MIAGYSGTLVPQFHLEQVLAREPRASAGAAARARWRDRLRSIGPASSIRAVHETVAACLAETLEAADIAVVSSSASQVAAVASAPGGAIALVTLPWNRPLAEGRAAAIVTAMGCSATWALIFNGARLRLTHATHAYGSTYADLDLAVASADRLSFEAVAVLLRAAITAGGGHSARETALDDLVAAGRAASIDVCRVLRDGVLVASAAVTSALVTRRAHEADAAFEQALTIVYRVLFLLFAESRGLVPVWHPIYRASYSIDALRAAAERSQPGVWDTLRAIARLAHAGCRLGELRVAPFNGRLFSPARTPLAERRDLDDRAAGRAIMALTTTRRGGELIPYRDLGVEQLGTVYETLLDYEPRIDRQRGRAPNLTLHTGSGRRKATGSFYTPQSIADFVVRRTLGPLVNAQDPDGILRLRILDPAMGSGGFLVATCRFLAAAYERALIDSGDRHATDLDEQERAAIRRLISERCLYGVDLNPMAVQLARLSLWLATLAADRPLTFLDHHLIAGNSLVGAFLSALRFPPRWKRRARGASRLPLFDEEELQQAAVEALPVRFQLEQGPDDTLAQVRAKERALDALGRRESSLSRWKRVANAWCAPWFAGESADAIAKAFGSLSDSALGGEVALPATVLDRLEAAVEAVATRQRFCHWELEFPEAFFTASGERRPAGGFDAVIGNPPWEMVRGDSGSAEERQRRRDDAEAIVGFSRESGGYAAHPGGHANQYQLFVARAMSLTRTGGRLGLIVPEGLAIDASSMDVRQHLLSSCAVDALVGFHNQQAIFPVHRSIKFLALTATRGIPTDTIACRFGADDVRILEGMAEGDTEFPVHLSRNVLNRISPADLAIPAVRSAIELRIVERAAALWPSLGSADGWNVRFGRELNATDDRGVFQNDGLPVVGGKNIAPFHADFTNPRHRISSANAKRLLPSRPFEHHRLAYRDVAGAGNRVTLIAAILPPGIVSTHTLFCLKTPLDDEAQQFLCGLFNSFIVNFLVRLRVGTHVTTAIVEQLPVPPKSTAGHVFDDVVSLACLLGKHDDARARARLNAAAAALYQLSVDEFRSVLETFPLVGPEDRAAALAEYCGAGL